MTNAVCWSNQYQGAVLAAYQEWHGDTLIGLCTGS